MGVEAGRWGVADAGDGGAAEARPRLVRTLRGPIEIAMFGSGPAVLALHGAMGGYDQSLILARALGPPGFRYLAVSRPGYLETPLSAGRSAAAQADLLAELLDALGLPDAAVLAVSGGGPAAIEFGLRHAERCRGLVLVSAASGIVRTSVPLSFRLTETLVRLPIVGGLIEHAAQRRITRDPDAAAARSIPDPHLRAATLADSHAGPLVKALMLSTADRMARRLAGTDNDIRVTRHTEYPLERLTVPVLAVHGTADRAAPYAHAEHIAARVPEAALLAIEGGSHMAMFTHIRDVGPRVASFLEATTTRVQ